MKTVTSVSELIDVMGGFSDLAAWAGYEDYRGVHNWLSRGIPPSYHLPLTLEAARRGILIDPKVLGLDEENAETFRQMVTPFRHPPRKLGGVRHRLSID